MIRLEMKNYSMILIEKQLKYQLYHHRKIHRYEYLTGEDMLPSNQQQIIELARFTYSPLGKAFEKQIKTIEDQGEKQIDALKDSKPKEQTKAIEDKPNNQSKNTIIFNELVNKKNNNNGRII